MPEDAWLDGEEVAPDTFDELLTLLLRRGAAHLVYRGQPKYDLPLVCALSRALRKRAEAGGLTSLESMESMSRNRDFEQEIDGIETSLLRRFMEQAKGLAFPDLPARTDRLGWWELM